MNLKIVSPDKTVFDGEINAVVIPGTFGEFGVLPGHAEMINGLCTGICSYTKSDGSKEKLIVSKGVCHVFEDKIDVLSEIVESSKEINVEKANGNLKTINDELNSTDLSTEERNRLETERLREETRIALASE